MSAFPVLTLKQWIFVLLHAIITAIINAAINFGIACIMYRGKHTRISVWKLNDNTLAGDAGITVIIVIVISWIIDGLLTRNDVKSGRMDPILDWSPPRNGLLGLWLSRGDFNFISAGPTNRVVRFLLSGTRGFVYCVFVWCIFWPLSLAYLIPTYGGSTHITGWGPPVFKAVYSAIIGLVTTPFVTILAMSEAGRKLAEGGDRRTDLGALENGTGVVADDSSYVGAKETVKT